jgi:hypothetical protein
MLAPWLILNQTRYGSPTVDITGSPGIAGPLAPGGALDRVSDLGRLSSRLLDGVLPQEWIMQLDVWWIRGAVDVLACALLIAGVFVLVRDRRVWRAWFLALPLLCGFAVMIAIHLLTGSDSFYLRYLYGALLPFALGVGIGLAPRGPRVAHVLGLGAATVVVGAVWVDMAGFFWFNTVGRKLGII